MIEYKEFWEDLRSGRFALMVKESAKGQSVSNSQELFNVLKPLYAKDADIEKAYFIFLDGQNDILSIDCMFQGTIGRSSVYPREVVKKILAHKASALIMAHNHPSGNIEPSQEDIEITFKVMLAAHAIDVTMHEHMIIGSGYHSMADAGTMHTLRERTKQV